MVRTRQGIVLRCYPMYLKMDFHDTVTPSALPLLQPTYMLSDPFVGTQLRNKETLIDVHQHTAKEPPSQKWDQCVHCPEILASVSTLNLTSLEKTRVAVLTSREISEYCRCYCRSNVCDMQIENNDALHRKAPCLLPSLYICLTTLSLSEPQSMHDASIPRFASPEPHKNTNTKGIVVQDIEPPSISFTEPYLSQWFFLCLKTRPQIHSADGQLVLLND